MHISLIIIIAILNFIYIKYTCISSELIYERAICNEAPPNAATWSFDCTFSDLFRAVCFHASLVLSTISYYIIVVQAESQIIYTHSLKLCIIIIIMIEQQYKLPCMFTIGQGLFFNNIIHAISVRSMKYMVYLGFYVRRCSSSCLVYATLAVQHFSVRHHFIFHHTMFERVAGLK